MSENEQDLLFFNGVDGASGSYLLPPMTPEQVSRIAQGESFTPEEIQEFQEKIHPDAHFAVMEGIDPKNLAETGWGVIFAFDADPAIREALSKLLNHRKKQATQNQEHYYQEYTDARGYRYNKDKNFYESKRDFLARHNVGSGPADPDKMPYYLMIVGDPDIIPYRFQSQLSVQYAVGRIHFDTLEEYAQYAESVVAAETNEDLAFSPTATFFGVCNPGDAATNLSTQDLILPLSEWVAKKHPEWDVKTIVKEEATKARLGDLLGGSETPSLLFTGSHGMGFPNGDPRQLPHQGALLCQDWPGREWGRQPIPESFYFSGDDIHEDARLLGLIAFHFACYGAGCPQYDEFDGHKSSSGQRPEIAPKPFLARLPQKLLSHPKGGALAVIGHVDRAWGCSFSSSAIRGSNEDKRQIAVFQSAVKRLLNGHTVGSAIDYFDERYAEIASDLSVELEEINFGGFVDDRKLSGMWTENNDARNYAVIGDPAVRLKVSEKGKRGERATIETVYLADDIQQRAEERAMAEAGAKIEDARMQLVEPLETFVNTLQAEDAPEQMKADLQEAFEQAQALLNALKEMG